MPTKKKEPEPPWQVILEEIRSQNRATIEAVEANRETLEQRMDQLHRATGVRLDTLETAVEYLTTEVKGNREAIEANRERIEQLDEATAARFDALERALSQIDRESRSRDASLDVAIRDLKVSLQQNSVDLRDLATKVAALARLEERVAALERRSA